MKYYLALGIYVGAFLILAACSPESSTMYAQKPAPQPVEPVRPQYAPVETKKANWITIYGDNTELDFNPQVDILFVIDNSDSMATAQRNLSRNIGLFAEGINKNAMIDYHIGVISTWDNSDAFAKNKKDPFGIGELRYVKDASGKTQNKRYVTRQDAGLLASTLSIGVAPLAEGGPENEEFFAPLTAAIEKTGRGATNEGFFRPNAQLAVVIMTDADEYKDSRTSPEEMMQRLKDFNPKASVYGVLVKASDDDSYKDWGLRIHPKYAPESCFTKNAKGALVNNGTCAPRGPETLEKLIPKSNIMSLVNANFGNDLKKIGSNITVKTLEKTILLPKRPQVVNGKIQLRVRYGSGDELTAGKGQEIPMDSNVGWVYEPNDNTIFLSGNIQYKYKENGRFAVDMLPVPE